MEAWLTRMYERHGRLYAAAIIAIPVAIALVLVPVAFTFPASYLELSIGEWLVAAVLVDLCVAGSIAAALAVHWKRIRPLFDWSGGQRTPELALLAERSAFTAVWPTVVVGVALIAVSGLLPLGWIFVGASQYSTAADIVGVGTSWLAIVAVLGLTGYVLIEFGIRPLRASLHAHGMPESSAPGLTTALLATPLVILFLATGGINYLTLDRDAGADQLLRALAIAAGLTAFGAIPFLLVAFGGVFAPLRRLVLGHRAVASGDLSRIDVVSANEIGELTASFNRMVHGLEEREALRGENTELIDELQASRARIVAASDAARRRVERDLHDGAQQNLVLLNLKLGLLERQAETDPELTEAVRGLRADLNRALDELRDLAHGIYPAVLTSDGLAGALAEAVEDAPIATSLTCDGSGRYPPELEAAIFFCCREALQNAAKHAGDGARVSVRLAEASAELRFEVADDGAGFEAAGATTDSAGLQNMADRIGALGGELRVESAPGAGTTVAGTVPLNR